MLFQIHLPLNNLSNICKNSHSESSIKTIIKVIGENGFDEFGTAVPSPSSGLVDGGINDLSTKITEIISGD